MIYKNKNGVTATKSYLYFLELYDLINYLDIRGLAFNNQQYIQESAHHFNRINDGTLAYENEITFENNEIDNIVASPFLEEGNNGSHMFHFSGSVGDRNLPISASIRINATTNYRSFTKPAFFRYKSDNNGFDHHQLRGFCVNSLVRNHFIASFQEIDFPQVQQVLNGQDVGDNDNGSMLSHDNDGKDKNKSSKSLLNKLKSMKDKISSNSQPKRELEDLGTRRKQYYKSDVLDKDVDDLQNNRGANIPKRSDRRVRILQRKIQTIV
jgi:hypothetical protein